MLKVRTRPGPEQRSPTRPGSLQAGRAPLYTPEQRARRNESRWTLVQGILAPTQFLVMIVSAVLVVRSLETGTGYGLATASVLLKTGLLYAIMVTGALWEKDVFGQYLFAHAFFWEDVVSSVVMVLHTAYVAMLFLPVRPEVGLWLALVAYAVYAVNAAQFVWKLRQARLQSPALPAGGMG